MDDTANEHDRTPPYYEHMNHECVECGDAISLTDDLEIGEIVDCQTCGTELEVLDTDPVTLDRAPELEEDWGE